MPPCAGYEHDISALISAKGIKNTTLRNNHQKMLDTPTEAAEAKVSKSRMADTVKRTRSFFPNIFFVIKVFSFIKLMSYLGYLELCIR
jgi:hypothetical protein